MPADGPHWPRRRAADSDLCKLLAEKAPEIQDARVNDTRLQRLEAEIVAYLRQEVPETGAIGVGDVVRIDLRALAILETVEKVVAEVHRRPADKVIIW